MTDRVLQIVTGLPPDIDGVGDYALTLARELRKQSGIDSLFLVGNPEWSGASRIEGFRAAPLPQRNAQVFDKALRELLTASGAPLETPIILHCSMYGYATRALPFWLVQGCEAWRHRLPDASWITMFHELVSTGPMWTTAFWSHRMQCHLIRRLARHSSTSIVSNRRYCMDLGRIAQMDVSAIEQLAVLSTVGEPASHELLPPTARQRQLVVFGRPSSRNAVFERSGAELEVACARLGVERILEIGPEPTSRKVRGVGSVQALGSLRPEEVSSILRGSALGLVAVDADLLGKSSVFAALCAHGVAPLVAGQGPVGQAGLQPHVHYFPSAHPAACQEKDIDSVSHAAYQWYQDHTSEKQASRYATIAFGQPSIEACERV